MAFPTRNGFDSESLDRRKNLAVSSDLGVQFDDPFGATQWSSKVIKLINGILRILNVVEHRLLILIFSESVTGKLSNNINASQINIKNVIILGQFFLDSWKLNVNSSHRIL